MSGRTTSAEDDAARAVVNGKRSRMIRDLAKLKEVCRTSKGDAVTEDAVIGFGYRLSVNGRKANTRQGGRWVRCGGVPLSCWRPQGPRV